jgi:hypothetical protein
MPVVERTRVHATTEADWTPQQAEKLARECGITSLGERHWLAISAYRQIVAMDGRMPSQAELIAASGLSHSDILELFCGAPTEVLPVVAGVLPVRPSGRRGIAEHRSDK